MKEKFIKFSMIFVVLVCSTLPIFSQPKLMDSTTKVEYAIEWHLNGGIQNKANPDIYTAEDGLTLAEPTRPGYIFDGWYLNPYLGGIKETSIPKGSTQKKVFYARWIITKEEAIKRMNEEMVTVIPSGKKVNLENFAGKDEIQTINAYMIGKYEVTQDLYIAVMQYNPSEDNSVPVEGEVQEKRPVENISWYDAICFCNKLSLIMGLKPAYSIKGETDPKKWDYTPHRGGKISSIVFCDYSANGFRLPTEGEWEMAARGGVNGGWDYEYSGSDKIDDVAWYMSNSYDEINGGHKTHEVGKKNSNKLGIYDMSGNVWEWCNNDDNRSDEAIYRGGSNSEYANFCTVSNRTTYNRYKLYSRSSGLGFRVVRSIQ